MNQKQRHIDMVAAQLMVALYAGLADPNPDYTRDDVFHNWWRFRQMVSEELEEEVEDGQANTREVTRA